MGKEEMDINIYEALKSIRKRWLMILEIVLVCTIVSVVYSYFIANPVYSTSTKLFIGKQSTDTTTYDSNDVNMYQKLMETYAGFANSSDLLQSAIDDSGLKLTLNQVKDSFSVVTGSEDQFLTFTYTSNNIDEGVKMLNAITTEFKETSGKYIPNGTVETVETAKYPDSPISPNKPRNIAISIILGLFIGIGVALFIEHLDNTVKKKEEIELLLNVPVIGIVPEDDEEEFGKEEKKRKKKSIRGRSEVNA